MIEIDPEINIDKDKTMGKIDVEITIEEMGMCIISIEMVEIFTGAIVEIGVDQEKEVYSQEGMIIIIGKMEALDLDQGLEVDLCQEKQQIQTGLDVIDVKNMTTLQMNVQIL